MKKVAIGGGQGFWGDSPDAAIHMIRNADIQYMGCDYLAELTLSIMAKQQLKDPTKGFAPDFTTRILKEAGKEACISLVTTRVSEPQGKPKGVQV